MSMWKYSMWVDSDGCVVCMKILYDIGSGFRDKKQSLTSRFNTDGYKMNVATGYTVHIYKIQYGGYLLVTFSYSPKSSVHSILRVQFLRRRDTSNISHLMFHLAYTFRVIRVCCSSREKIVHTKSTMHVIQSKIMACWENCFIITLICFLASY